MPPNIQKQITNLIYLLAGNIVNITSISYQKEGNQCRVVINSENNQIFIDDNSELLKAIQHSLRVIVHLSNPNDRTHFFLDVDNYRKLREKTLSICVPELAEISVLKQGKTVIMINLTGYERLQVHNILSEVKGLQTTSVGKDDSRKLLIIPTSDIGITKLEDAIIFDLNQK